MIFPPAFPIILSPLCSLFLDSSFLSLLSSPFPFLFILIFVVVASCNMPLISLFFVASAQVSALKRLYKLFSFTNKHKTLLTLLFSSYINYITKQNENFFHFKNIAKYQLNCTLNCLRALKQLFSLSHHIVNLSTRSSTKIQIKWMLAGIIVV